VEDDGGEEDEPERPVDDEPGSDRDAVEEAVHEQAEERRCAGVPGEQLRMGLLAEVEVRCDRVLEEVDEQVAGEDQDGSEGREVLALGHHLQDDGRQHEPRPERDGIAEEAGVPVPERHDDAAEQVGDRREPDAEEAETQVWPAHYQSGGRAASSAPSRTSWRVPEPSVSSICFAQR